MDTLLLICVDLAAVAAVQLAVLWAVGWPVRVLLLGGATQRHHVAATPFIGMAVLQTVGWYAATRNGGIEGALLAVCAAGALASVAIGAWRLRARGALDVKRGLRPIPIVVVLGVLATGLFAFHYQAAYQDDPVGPVTAGNNDIAAYAIAAEHLLNHGFHEPGSVVGTHVGSVTEHDVFGAYALLATGAATTGLDVWATLLPALLMASFLCVLSMYCVVRGCTNLARAPAALIAVLSCASFLFVYLEVNYFLSQVVAMATTGLLFLLALDVARVSDRAQFLRTAGVAAALAVCVLFTYPHMVYLGVPLLVALASLVTAARHPTLRGAVGSMARGAAMGAAVLAVCLVVAPSRFVDAFRRTIALSDVMAGWPLPFVAPSQLLGFQRSFTPTPSRTTVGASVVLVVAALAAALAMRWRLKLRTEPFVAMTLGVLASYGVAYARYGVSYNQWKWISYFQPLLVVSLVAPIALAARELVRRLPGIARLSGVAAIALPLALVASATVNARHASKGAVVKVDEALLSLRDEPALHGLTSLNVDLGPYWETMWGMYAALEAGVGAVNPHSVSYYPRSPHSAEWTLRVADDGRGLLPGREARPLNAKYQLVRYSPTAPAEGTYHVMPGCVGLYHYTGGRWVALARTPASGEYRFKATVRLQPGRRDPVVVRGVAGRVDVVGMRHVDEGRVAFFHEHAPGDVAEGKAVALSPSKAAALVVVLDEVTNTVRVVVDGNVVLDLQRPLHRLGEWVAAEGVNDVGAGVAPAFGGTLEGEPVATETCRSLAAQHRLPL